MTTRYVESLDSVRFTNETDLAERLTHAELEVMLTLLFGDQIHLSQNQSFDSRGFLAVAPAVLAAKPAYTNSSPVARPFLLSLLFGQPYSETRDFKHLIAHQLERGHDNFILAAWPTISEDLNARKTLAKHVRKGKFKAARRDFPEHDEQLAALKQMARYFASMEISISQPPTTTLEQYVDYLASLPADTFPEHIYPQLREVPSAIQTLRNMGVVFANRTSIRNAHNSDDIAPSVMEFLLEYVDSAYNRVNADSIGANSAVYSNRGSGSDVNNIIAGLVAQKVSEQKGEIAKGEWSPFHLDIDSSKLNSPTVSALESIPGRWSNVWEILTDKEWIASVETMHRTYRDNVAFREAVHKHAELLGKRVADLQISYLDGKVRTVLGGAGAAVGVVAPPMLEHVFHIPISGSGAVILDAVTAFGGSMAPNLVERPLRWRAKGEITQGLKSAVVLG